MRFLHTGDWHVGKVFHEVSLIEDQREFLRQVCEELESARKGGNPYSALLVPGDVYDRAVPPAEATQLLSRFLNTVHSSFPELHLFFIAGNHDSAGRLSFARELLDCQNIHICTDTSRYTEPVVLENGGEAVCVYQLPFLYPLSISSGEEKLLRTQQEQYEYALTCILQAHDKSYSGIPAVLCAHLFTAKSAVGSSERSFVGTAEMVDTDVFNGFTYCALGHIHKCQPCGSEKRVYYSGSPLAYDFDDNPDTFMLSVTVNGAEVPSVQKIPVRPLHRLAVLEGAFGDFYGASADKKLIEKYRDCYVKISATDTSVVQGAMSLLRTNFPLCLSFVPKIYASALSSGSVQERKSAIESKNSCQIFEQFLSDAYGSSGFEEELPAEEKQCVQDEKKLFSELSKGLSW